jgi:hypothetical protein
MNKDKLAMIKGKFMLANQKTHPGRTYSKELFNDFIMAQSLSHNKETAAEIVTRWNLEAELEKVKKDVK